MAEVVNLNRFRKAKARAEARDEADANAAKFGRSKAQKAREAADAERARAELDGKKRETDQD
ncbi:MULTISPECIES: DUF4169 family protein [Gemmobacter]|jgi:hypothetical protein|uniref:Uncharacterized protein DUF4169 n=2 Tax=Gemmobacter TaxID=204456 RepID=A0A2T6B717_9RHOB|nr:MULTISPECIES: DUF4169 family protein [Gemmobacter]OJY33700.1 MAG: DUF4169 domain-containing protein [Rhodobacterales bacterium 65-51]PTX51843.1 uncharacterized protein DUF4169 [Gemmobacter caeni]TWJ03971.1 uncharacterized protein DUF4169 [Gemmobacter caeni]GHC11223.1 hypothetical protein GCM10007291_04870 [Gemmobacter nanjingensis]